ncbi:MAG: DivIVA domain-containing protein, partial [Gemmatimonadota bacterium]
MIDLTPLEVRQKKADFPKGLRGYEPGHVDDFLDLVADRLEALVKDNRRLGEEIAELRSSAGEYKDREKALTEALVSAQQMREEVREQATKEASLMRREAEHEAERVRDEAMRAIEKEEETLRRLRARQRQLVEGYRTMLERE